MTSTVLIIEIDENAALADDEHGTLDAHVCENLPKKQVIEYSNATFKLATAELLAATDQPLSALNHPKFKEMINIASHAEDEVAIPSDKEI
ncbi:hypothetical protein C0995_004638 [Termitomyces sp. Mi166|nr:hypothetical protein C0995_004638 [Termitomyces sp. Mi166\